MHVRLNVIWDWEAPAGSGDGHFAMYRGTRSRVEVRQTRADGFRTEVYVVANDPEARPQVLAAVRQRVAAVQSDYPGVGVEDRREEIRVTIPDALRVGHEAHFAQVTDAFLGYVRTPGSLPAWERPNLLAKYYVTTKGTELSRDGAPSRAPRIAPE
ncbi:MAG: putative oxidoreductase C-terminal domain-containing protein [Acidobacteriota bacterium]